MRLMKTFTTFNERLGIVEDLEDIATEILNNLKDSNYYELERNYLGRNIKIECYFDTKEYKEDSSIVASFSTIKADMKNNIYKFRLRTRELVLSTIIHELKHLHRELVFNLGSDYIKNDKGFHLNHIGREVGGKYKFLSHNKSFDALLTLLYYFDNNEFEAYYNEIYYDIKSMINDNMSIDEKKKLITKELSANSIYVTYRFINSTPFKIENMFRNNADLKAFISELDKNINIFISKNMIYTIPTVGSWNILKLKVKRVFNLLDNNLDKKDKKEIKSINAYINKNVQKNYKKFHRLYTLLT